MLPFSIQYVSNECWLTAVGIQGQITHSAHLREVVVKRVLLWEARFTLSLGGMRHRQRKGRDVLFAFGKCVLACLIQW